MVSKAWAALGMAVLALGAASGDSPVRVVRLRCEYRVDPLGIDVAKPRLDWVLESPRRGERQAAYQVLAARTEEVLAAGRGDLWDSGRVESDRSTHVVYGGADLKSGERACWKVRVWDRDGAASPWSAPASWEMGLLRPEDWQARWIAFQAAPAAAGPKVHVPDLRWIWFPGDPAQNVPKADRCFRRAFEVSGKVRRAEAFFTADNRFTLFVNGKPAGQGGTWEQFERLDVKAHLVQGQNVLAVVAGNEDGPAGLIGQLQVETEEGSPLYVSTDKGWKSSEKPAAGWQTKGFDDKGWADAKELAPLGQGPWGDKLSAANVGGAPSSPGPLLRKSFALAGPVRKARLYATALGLYELRLNGQRVGIDRLTPGWTDYRKRLQVQTYDVTKLLVPGENALGAMLGDGWCHGKIGWLPRGHKTYGPGPARLLLQLHVELADGSRAIVAGDGAWKGSRGPVLGADLLDGESYDARLEQPGWDKPGFKDAAWGAVEVADERSDRRLVADCTDPVRVTQELKPLKVTEPKPGVFVFDLGQNMVGWARLRVRGEAGTAVTLRFAEMLNPDGTIYTTNLRKAKCADQYVLRGGGEEVWEPRFTFHGFRYVELTGTPGKPGLDAVTGCVAHSSMTPAGVFETSNRMVNQLQSNIVWGQRGNFLSVPTDCPQRDERLGWMGDAQIFVRTACFNYDVAPFFTKWVRDVVDAQNADGAFADVSPRLSGVLPADAAPAWGDAGIICPWTVYQCYGDTRILEEHYPAYVRWVEHIRRANPGLLWKNRVGNNYGDWVSIGSNTDKGVLATAYFALSSRLVSRIAKVLGKEEDEKKYEELFRSIKAAFNKEFVAGDGKIRSHTQTCYLLALRFDLLPEEKRPAAVKYLVDDLEAHKGHLTTGFLGVGHLLPALSENGRTDVAYRLLLNETFPSWGYSIRHGATTIWERWDGWTAEKGFQDPGMNSFNHYSFGSVGEWMVATVAGIDLAAPGYKKILIRPRPGGGFTHARAEYDSIHGKIVSSWKIEGGTFRLQVTVPANTSATVELPAAEGVTEGGKPAREAEGVAERGKGVYEVGSGRYEFAVRMP
jgi:alpha-L-rhamnosidase